MTTFDLKFSEERVTLLRICQNLAELDVECCLAGIHKTDPHMVVNSLQNSKHRIKRKKINHFSRKNGLPKNSKKRIGMTIDKRIIDDPEKKVEKNTRDLPGKKKVVHHHHHHHHRPPPHLNSPIKYPGGRKVDMNVGRKRIKKTNKNKKRKKVRNFETRTTANERDLTFAEIKVRKEHNRRRILKSDPNKLFRRKYLKRRIKRQNRRIRERKMEEESFAQNNGEGGEETFQKEPGVGSDWDWKRKLEVFHQLRQKLLEEKQVREHFSSSHPPTRTEKEEEIKEEEEEEEATEKKTSQRMIPMADIVEEDPSLLDESQEDEVDIPEEIESVGSEQNFANNDTVDEDDELQIVPTPVQKLSIIEKKSKVDSELEEFLRKRVVDKDGMYRDLLKLEEEQNEIRGRFEKLRDQDFSSVRSSITTVYGEDVEFDEYADENVFIRVEDGIVLDEDEKNVITEKRKNFFDSVKRNNNNMEVGKSSEIVEIVGGKLLDEIFSEIAAEVFDEKRRYEANGL